MNPEFRPGPEVRAGTTSLGVTMKEVNGDKEVQGLSSRSLQCLHVAEMRIHQQRRLRENGQ